MEKYFISQKNYSYIWMFYKSMIKEEMHLLAKQKRFRIGLRTLKTAAAVIISMMIVTSYGATTSRLIFAMLGAMATMAHTFKESLESCLTQFVGTLMGAIIGIILIQLPIAALLNAGIGIVVVITLYNMFHINFSPSLPCLIVAIICTTPDIQPFTYAIGRLWDTAIGLSVGMIINTLVFPYNNSRQIRATAECLETELIAFLEDMFDGDNHLPDTERMSQMIDDMTQQLKIFSSQWLLLYLKQNRQKLVTFQVLEGKARQLVAHMEVLCRMHYPGRLNGNSRKRLEDCGAKIKDERILDVEQELDIVTNYHVSQILTLRQELIDVLTK